MANPNTLIDALFEAAQALADECAEAEKRGSSILQSPIICSHETILAMHQELEARQAQIEELEHTVSCQKRGVEFLERLSVSRSEWIIELEAENAALTLRREETVAMCEQLKAENQRLRDENHLHHKGDL